MSQVDWLLVAVATILLLIVTVAGAAQKEKVSPKKQTLTHLVMLMVTECEWRMPKADVKYQLECVRKSIDDHLKGKKESKQDGSRLRN
jgi:hypothetical protein